MARAIRVFLACCLAIAVLGGCDGNGPAAANQSGLPRLGVLWQMVQVSTAPDTDGDYLPDDVEAVVGTKRTDRDTDRDGLPDNYEIFGSGYFDEADYVPDLDGDAKVAPLDADDDADGENDGEVIDTDGDGIANYLEYYGFCYDWLTGRFIAWDGDPAKVHWRTDPLQPSTDQDAYGDGQECSGAIMDVAVRAPGDNPLVPAYPNIVVKLEGYSVTLNETITYTDGGSLAKGSTWNRETTETHSSATERNWEVGAEVTFDALGVSGGFHANYGESYTSTQTTSTAVSVGGSVLDEANWSRARSLNPTDAARIKLFLKVHNYGTASVSNVVPTLTLRIGGLNIETFEPGNAQVNVLVPGGEYPPDPGVHWVVDSIDTGTGVIPLSLTMDELRALERGAPVSIAVTQLKGDVMLASGGGFVNAGDCNEYLARCDAVGANLRVDMGEGSFLHYLVYADDTPSAPRATLGEALRQIGLDEDGLLHYADKDGTPRVLSLEGYTFIFDQETLIRNGWDLDTYPATPPQPGFPLEDTVLGPGTSVFMKAPRDLADVGPTVYFAYVDPQSLEIKVCTADYQGIESVLFVDKDGGSDLMIEEMADTGFYFLVPDPDYVFDGTEKVIVTNLAGQTEERILQVVFYPQPEAPVINFVTLDLAGLHLYANVTNPMPSFPIQWVRALHPGFQKGYLDLQKPVNEYEDPDGWVAQLPTGWSAINVKIVAYVATGVYAEMLVSAESVVTPLRVGTADLYAAFDWTATDDWRTTAIDLDKQPAAVQGFHDNKSPHTLVGTHAPFLHPWELYHWWHNDLQWELGFNVPWAVGTAGSFDSITRDQIMGLVQNPTGLLSTSYSNGDIFLLKTSDGNYAKVMVLSNKDDSSWWGEWRDRHLTVKYVVYAPPQAYAGPDRDVVVSPLQKTVTLNGAGSSGATTYSWTLAVPGGSFAILTGAGTATPSFTPDVAGDYVATLMVNGDPAMTDTVTVHVSLPFADAGDDRFVTFRAALDDYIELDGTASFGADKWTWKWDGSSAATPTLLHADTSTPEFVPTVSGDYILTLIVNEGEGTYEHTDTVTISVTVQ